MTQRLQCLQKTEALPSPKGDRWCTSLLGHWSKQYSWDYASGSQWEPVMAEAWVTAVCEQLQLQTCRCWEALLAGADDRHPTASAHHQELPQRSIRRGQLGGHQGSERKGPPFPKRVISGIPVGKVEKVCDRVPSEREEQQLATRTPGSKKPQQDLQLAVETWKEIQSSNFGVGQGQDKGLELKIE